MFSLPVLSPQLSTDGVVDTGCVLSVSWTLKFLRASMEDCRLAAAPAPLMQIVASRYFHYGDGGRWYLFITASA